MSALFERLTGLALRDPAWLLLVAALPLVLWLGRRQPAPALTLAPLGILGPLPASWRVRLLGLPRVLACGGLLLLVLALARPVEQVRVQRESAGIDILLCLDTSSSMLADDMDQRRTRLDVARDAALAFVRARPHDRIGLITFARYPDLRCPPTLDHAALERLLAEVGTVAVDGPEDATGLGAAVARAAEVLESADARSRVVILITDGEENVALVGAAGEIAPAHAAQLCADLGVRVYGIVAGTGRPAEGGGWTPLDTTAVRLLAERTGGRFQEARQARDIGAVYARIDALETTPAPEHDTRLLERFLPFLAVGLVLLTLSRLLGASVLAVAP